MWLVYMSKLYDVYVNCKWYDVHVKNVPCQYSAIEIEGLIYITFSTSDMKHFKHHINVLSILTNFASFRYYFKMQNLICPWKNVNVVSDKLQLEISIYFVEHMYKNWKLSRLYLEQSRQEQNFFNDLNFFYILFSYSIWSIEYH